MKDRAREATARSILDAAELAFAEEGLQGARMEAIAAGAGVAVGTLYNYFDDRSALLAALLLARREALCEALDRELALPLEGRAWGAQLESFLGAFLAHVETHRAFFALLFQGDLGNVHTHEPRRAAIGALERRFEEIVRRGLSAGVLRRESSELYPLVLMGMCRAVALHALGDVAADLTGRAGALADLFLRGAGAGP